jgi:hypothetical protein
MSDQGKPAVQELTTEVEILRFVLGQIISDLPDSRDWLDPMLETAARELTGIPRPRVNPIFNGNVGVYKGVDKELVNRLASQAQGILGSVLRGLARRRK